MSPAGLVPPRAALALASLALVVLLSAGCSDDGLAESRGNESLPPGELLIQQRGDDGLARIFRYDLRSGDADQVSPEGASSVAARWRPDGTRIVRAEQPVGDPNVAIRTSAADGDDPATVSDGAIETFPAWSPDCASLAFVVLDMMNGVGELVITAADGSDRRIVWSGPGLHGSPDWSPDGDRLVFQSERGGDAEIVVIDVDGSAEVVLTDNDVGDTTPRWSPDGTTIVYASRVNDRKQLFAVAPDGSDRVQLTRSNQGGEFPVWSPDGGWIAYARGGTELALLRADGSELIDTGLAGQPTDWRPAGTCP